MRPALIPLNRILIWPYYHRMTRLRYLPIEAGRPKLKFPYGHCEMLLFFCIKRIFSWHEYPSCVWNIIDLKTQTLPSRYSLTVIIFSSLSSMYRCFNYLVPD